MSTQHRTPVTVPMTMTEALVVDTDDGVRLALRALLEDAGYVVSEASTAREAVIYLLSNPDASVIVLDVSRPLSEDLVFLQWIFSGEFPTARHAFVLLSTNPVLYFGPTLARAPACGVPIVAKPFDIDDLLDAVTFSIGHMIGHLTSVAIDDLPVTTSAALAQ